MVAVVWAGKQGLTALLSVEWWLPVCIMLGVAVYVTVILVRAPNVARELAGFLRLAMSPGDRAQATADADQT
jgi:hypothetical protein